MTCLRCARPLADPGRGPNVSEFCSRRCEERHRTTILSRLEELREEGAGLDAGNPLDLLSLAQSVSGAARGVSPDPPAAPAGSIEISSSCARVVTFLPVQGGSGASTISLHVAEALARRSGGRVLLVDFDFHSGTTAFRLGLEPHGSLLNLLDQSRSTMRLEDAVGRWGPLDILPPGVSPAASRVDFSQLGRILEEASERYAAVVVDHPDGLYSSSQAILEASAVTYLVCTPEIAALHLARRKHREIAERTLNQGVDSRGPLRLIVNRASSWGSLKLEDIARVTGLPIEAPLDNDYAAVRQANWTGKLIEPNSTLARQFDALADAVFERLASARTAAQGAEHAERVPLA